MNIKGKKIVLRAIERDDLSLLHKWSNDPNLQDALGDIHFPSSKDFHVEWYNSIQRDQLNFRFAIECDELGLVGLSSLMKVDWKNNHAWHGIFLGDKEIRGKGYGRDAVMATMRYAFDELHLERLEGCMIQYNDISINFYCDKLGWRREGIRKNYYYRKGRYWDQILVGITKSEYYELIQLTDFWND
jgi:RimJ/RimL family protein N-acetyltransferase